MENNIRSLSNNVRGWLSLNGAHVRLKINLFVIKTLSSVVEKSKSNICFIESETVGDPLSRYAYHLVLPVKNLS